MRVAIGKSLQAQFLKRQRVRAIVEKGDGYVEPAVTSFQIKRIRWTVQIARRDIANLNIKALGNSDERFDAFGPFPTY